MSHCALIELINNITIAEVNVKAMVLRGHTAGSQPGSLKDQGDFPGGSGSDVEAERLCKMDWSQSSEEHRDCFAGTKVACVTLLSWARVEPTCMTERSVV